MYQKQPKEANPVYKIIAGTYKTSHYNIVIAFRGDYDTVMESLGGKELNLKMNYQLYFKVIPAVYQRMYPECSYNTHTQLINLHPP